MKIYSWFTYFLDQNGLRVPRKYLLDLMWGGRPGREDWVGSVGDGGREQGEATTCALLQS